MKLKLPDIDHSRLLTMASMLNHRHLYYFWVVAQEGGFAKAAKRLDMAVQTISAQVRELERSLGHELLRPDGRGVALTDAGRVALTRAEQMFQISDRLQEDVRAAAQGGRVRLTVGLSDGLSKPAAHAVLQPVLRTPGLHLVCHEGETEQLIAELALHQLDVVLSGQPAPHNPTLRLLSDRLSDAPVAWWAPKALVRPEHQANFPDSLQHLPLLVPTTHSALRVRLDRWFELQGWTPHIAGEFEDSALLSLFAQRGMGVFPVSVVAGESAPAGVDMVCLGRTEEVREEVYAIRARRGMLHPLVRLLLEAALPEGLVQDGVANTSKKTKSNS